MMFQDIQIMHNGNAIQCIIFENIILKKGVTLAIFILCGIMPFMNVKSMNLLIIGADLTIFVLIQRNHGAFFISSDSFLLFQFFL